MVAPGEEPDAGVIIRHAGVFVADGGGEEFEEAAGGFVAGVGNNTRHQDPSRVATARVLDGEISISCAMPVSVT